VAKICRGGNLAPQGGTWVIPALPNHEGETQCTESGGVVEESNGRVCGTEQNAHPRAPGTSSSSQALTAAVVAPLRRLRSDLAETDIVRELSVVNYSPAVHRLVENDPRIRRRLTEAIGVASSYAVAVLLPSDDQTSLELVYNDRLHEWFVRLARDIQRGADDDEVRSAIDRVVSRMEGFVGRSIGDVYRSVREGG
jgi:hypothetical protein